MESWKIIKHMDRYEVSDLGRIRNRKTKRPVRSYSSKGYTLTNLYTDRGRVHGRVHRLVAEAFVGKLLEGLDVDHINRDRSDNRAVNLRICLSKLNQANKINKVGIVKHIIELYESGKSEEEILRTVM